MSNMKRFLLYCSGADLKILEQCPTDENKYIGIGGTVLFTGILALFSAGYAIYTVFDSYFFAFVFGLIWGLMIFNLDRYIVSSMKSRGSFFRDFTIAFPRLLLAVLLALVISKPLELKIFEKEINAELITMEQEVFKKQENTIKERYQDQMAGYQQDIAGLNSEIDKLAAARDTLALMALQEADGTGGSGNKNLGPIYRAKKAKADEAQAELEVAKERLAPLIAEKHTAVQQLDSMMQADMLGLERKPYGGMAARMDALHRLGEQSKAIFLANIFIMLLFIAIETAPIFVKLISSRSPYDYLLHQAEHKFEMANLEEITLLRNATQNKVQFDTETGVHRTRKEIEVEKELAEEYYERKKAALKDKPLVDWNWSLPFFRGKV